MDLNFCMDEMDYKNEIIFPWKAVGFRGGKSCAPLKAAHN